MQHTTDARLKDQLQVGLIYLQDFVPDVEADPREQRLQQAKALAKEAGVNYDELVAKQRLTA